MIFKEKKYLVLVVFMVIGLGLGIMMSFGLFNQYLPTFADEVDTGSGSNFSSGYGENSTGEKTAGILSGQEVSNENLSGEILTGENQSGDVQLPTKQEIVTLTSSVPNVSTGYIITERDKSVLEKLYGQIDKIIAKSQTRAQKVLKNVQNAMSKVKTTGRSYKLLSLLENYMIDALSDNNDIEELAKNIFSGDDAEEVLKQMCDNKASLLKNTGKVYLALYDNYTGDSFKARAQQYGASVYIIKNPSSDLTGENKFMNPNNMIPTEYISCRYGSKTGENTNYLYCEGSDDFEIEKKVGADGQIISNGWSKGYFYKLVLNVSDEVIQGQDYKNYIAGYQSFEEAYKKGEALYSGINYQILQKDEGYKSFQKWYQTGLNQAYFRTYNYIKNNIYTQQISDEEKAKLKNEYLESKAAEIYKKYFFPANIVDMQCLEKSFIMPNFEFPLNQN